MLCRKFIYYTFRAFFVCVLTTKTIIAKLHPLLFAQIYIRWNSTRQINIIITTTTLLKKNPHAKRSRRTSSNFPSLIPIQKLDTSSNREVSEKQDPRFDPGAAKRGRTAIRKEWSRTHCAPFYAHFHIERAKVLWEFRLIYLCRQLRTFLRRSHPLCHPPPLYTGPSLLCGTGGSYYICLLFIFLF